MRKARELDVRWVFLALAAALTLAVRFPFSQPITPSPAVKAVYDYIEALPEGSTILIATDYDPQARAEVVPITQALLRHAFSRGIRVIGMTFWPDGAPLGARLFRDIGDEYGKTSGVDYVYLGYKFGGMAQVITNMGESFTSAFPADPEGNRTATMPVFEEVRNLRSVDYLIDIAAGETVTAWVMYGADKYRIPMAAGCTAVVGPDLYVFMNTGQLNGLIAGLRGAADYEVLIGSPDLGVRGMPAQSAAHGMIVLFVIVANVLYFRKRLSLRSRRQAERD